MPHDKNVVFSALSIDLVMAMAYLGAAGKTADELAEVMNYGLLSNADIETYYRKVTDTIATEGLVKMATKFFVRDSFKLKKAYQASIVKNFKSEIEAIDFNNPQAAVDIVNSWTALKTAGKIKDIVSTNDIDQLTRVVIVNAIYFKADWKKQFRPFNTKPKLFWLSAVNSIEIPTMSQRNCFHWANLEKLDSSAIQLNYKNCDMSMLIVLPNQREGLIKLEEQLQDIDIDEILSVLKQENYVGIQLPKFEFEYEVNLKDALQTLGIKEAFDMDNGNFPNVLLKTSDPNYYISGIIHKACLKVDEEGTVAAAATQCMFILFLLSIKPNKTKNLIFQPQWQVEVELEKILLLIIHLLSSF